MPFQTPPTFSNGAILTASQLNILSDNLEYFYGLSTTVNIPFARRIEDLRTTLDSNKSFWQIRHRAQYLNVYIQYAVDAAQVNHLAWTVTYGGTTIANVDPIAYASPSYVNFDLNALGSFTLGTWYEIVVDAIAHDAAHAVPGAFGTSYFYILRMFESDTAAS